ncbi:MAG TPA: PadR family transcriptional regulator [Spirochaetota bacterium]|nr:PadR family transcriptional regulator [Spirochaetota bacterium]HOL57523.1 PadR family transcriptional regulator [Spirochaetota bacterium]HPP05006.1 PadR family transcriptional regulator [Spirochaetota bacterium]
MTDSELMILSFIKDGLNYPYIIEKIIEKKKLRDFFELSFSSIYFLINTLEEKKLINTFKTFSKKKINKKGVNITEEGEKLLNEALKQGFKAKLNLSNPIDYTIYNCHNLSFNEIKNGITEYIKEMELIYEYYKQRLEECEKSKNEKIGEYFVLKHFIAKIKSELEWAKEIKTEILNTKNFNEILQMQKDKNIEEFCSLLLEE